MEKIPNDKYPIKKCVVIILLVIATLTMFHTFLSQQNQMSLPKMTFNEANYNGAVKQWYYQNDGSFTHFFRDDMAWAGDNKTAKPDVDIDYDNSDTNDFRRKITIAVIDTDIDYNHKSFRHSMANHLIDAKNYYKTAKERYDVIKTYGAKL